MPEKQQWDIVSGVGITALFVAAGRALETRREQPLVNDPYAATLVAEANAPITLPPQEGREALWDEMADYIGVRSRFFDEWFDGACARGARQAVILASGLDTRAFRRNWPAGFRVFEIDQPRVLAFKETVLAEVGASCSHHPVPVDLRDDWAQALAEAPFDPETPTAWLAEGLIPYLPAEAVRRLVEAVHGLSAPGSSIAIEDIDLSPQDLAASESVQQAAQQWGIELTEMLHFENRPVLSELLAARDWRTHREMSADLAARYGRPLSESFASLVNAGSMLTATLPG